MSRTQPTTNRPSLPVDITTLIAAQEKCHACNLISNSAPLQRIQLPDLAFRAALPRAIEYDLRHACFDEARADCVDPDAGPAELVGDCLRDGDDGCLGGGVVCGAGVGAQACY